MNVLMICHVTAFLHSTPRCQRQHLPFTYSPFSPAGAVASGSQLDISHLDSAVQFFCRKGVADSTHKTYQSALRRFGAFCALYGILSPFPVSEALLCYFAAAMANDHLAPQTIKTYLSTIRFMQISLGLPEPREFSSPRLHLVQMAIKRTHYQRVPLSTKVRLPITPAILHRIKVLWSFRASDHDIIMLWAAACLCFFVFFPFWRDHNSISKGF